ncbi:MAG: HEAT repeat domain-containing protein [Actinobacteria bacterium]|nr:HEAT repeat domain-containing protein [Actinomycetota bacterium]
MAKASGVIAQVRAILALAPFDDPRIEPLLRSALEDRDWQVRQNAEDMLNPRG